MTDRPQPNGRKFARHDFDPDGAEERSFARSVWLAVAAVALGILAVAIKMLRG